MRIFLMTNGPKFGVTLAIVVSAAREKQCERLQWSEYSSVVAASGQQLTFFGDTPHSGFYGIQTCCIWFLHNYFPTSFHIRDIINLHLISRSRNSYKTNIEIFLSDPSLVKVFPFHSSTNCC